MSEVQLKKDLYTATAFATGGRNGNTQTKDGFINFDLSIPKVMGGLGKPNTTTPEDLFAAGYAACFGSACDFAAKSILKVKAETIRVDADVTIGEDVAGGFGLKVHLKVQITGLDGATVNKVIEAAHQVCPYSKATRGNVQVKLDVNQ